MIYLLIALQGYLFGSISSSVLLSKKMYGTDIRTHGSGNAGATNAARVFGMGMGLITLLCDAVKMAAAVYIGRWLGGDIGFAVGGAACLIGHCWPVFFRFRGGKGVSVGAMLGLMIDWRVFLCLAAVFFGLFALTRTVSVCSVGAAAALPVLAFLFRCPLPHCLLAVFTGLLVIFAHRSNLVRLANHQEAKFVPGKKENRPAKQVSKE